MIGGDKAAFEPLEPVFAALAPPDGYAHLGPSGAGHFVKMVHNGIEYGLMQAYAEGFELLEAKAEYGLDNAAIARLWNRGSVVRSWLLELAETALGRSPHLQDIKGYVDDSGEGRWTVQEAIDRAVPVPAMSLALFARFRSREEESFGRSSSPRCGTNSAGTKSRKKRNRRRRDGKRSHSRARRRRRERLARQHRPIPDQDGPAEVADRPRPEGHDVQSHDLRQGRRRGPDYDDQIRGLRRGGASAFGIYDELTTTDVRDAADVFKPVYDRTGGLDGFVSLEINPKLAAMPRARSSRDAALPESRPAQRDDQGARDRRGVRGRRGTDGRGDQRQHHPDVLDPAVPRNGPGLRAGHQAARRPARRRGKDPLRGQRLRQPDRHGRRRPARGPHRPRVRRAAEGAGGLAQGPGRRRQLPSLLRRFPEHLRGRGLPGARRERREYQRPLWGSTSAKNPAYSDVKYVEELIARDTVNTMPEKTFSAFLDHGRVAEALTPDASKSEAILAELGTLGISIDNVCDRLLEDGVRAFDRSLDDLLQTIEKGGQLMKPLIILGSDHAGFRIKQFIEGLLVAKCYRVEDVGTWSTASVDYPDFAEKLALRVRGGRGRKGILTCGTGIGMSIAANKVPGIRAALVCNVRDARLSIEHNNANVLVLGGGRSTGRRPGGWSPPGCGPRSRADGT